MKLTIELVPKTSWYSNVRGNVSSNQWDVIRNKCYKAANYRCEICGEIGKKHPVECHEIWRYEEITKENKQTLIGFIALCPNCHKVKHLGLAQINDEMNIVINQLMFVNLMTPKEAMDYIAASFDLWQRRSDYKWKVDIEFIRPYLNNL